MAQGLVAIALCLLAGCGGAASSRSGVVAGTPPPSVPQSSCSGALQAGATDGMTPTSPTLVVPSGFSIREIAHIGGARELAALPNGDLLVGTLGGEVMIVPNAEGSANAGAPRVFASFGDAPAAGVAFDEASCTIVVGTHLGVSTIPYVDGDRQARAVTRIARVRTGSAGGHATTSVAIADGTIYASVGSSCDACVESDPTRARILAMNLDGTNLRVRATRIRNAIGLTIDSASGELWAGGAGQDALPQPHPYEYIDDVSAHVGIADYGWPDCEENRVAYVGGADCSATVVPLVETPAYSTIIGITFYPRAMSGRYAFPAAYAGALFATHHGSWHTLPDGCHVQPDVVVVPMRGDVPATPVHWSDPSTQWTRFLSGFQPGCSDATRIGRPTGISVGREGSLFVADDAAGAIYRIRPNTR